ncbi:hypothetical protein Tco_1532656 [Tanacetum coccineum]
MQSFFSINIHKKKAPLNLRGSISRKTRQKGQFFKDAKEFDFVTESGEHVHLTKERISAQKKIEEEAKAEAARHEGEMRKEELIDLLGPEVVKKKGPITLKVYREDDTSEIIPEFKASDLHLGEWREVVKACPNKKASSASALQVLRRLGSIFTSVYAAVQKLKKALGWSFSSAWLTIPS